MTSKCTHFIAQPDVFGQNGSEKGTEMAPTLIKPMNNHQTSLAESIFFVRSIFLYVQKKSLSFAKFPGSQGLEFRNKGAVFARGGAKQPQVIHVRDVWSVEFFGIPCRDQRG